MLVTDVGVEMSWSRLWLFRPPTSFYTNRRAQDVTNIEIESSTNIHQASLSKSNRFCDMVEVLLLHTKYALERWTHKSAFFIRKELY